MKNNTELGYFRHFYHLLQGVWLTLALGALLFNVMETRHEVDGLARQAAILEKERTNTIREWVLHQKGLEIKDEEGKSSPVLSPAQVLSQIQSLLPADGVHSRLVSPVPLNPRNIPDAWERRKFAALNNGYDVVREKVRGSDNNMEYRELHAMEKTQRCLECHPGYKNILQPAALSIRVPLEPIHSMLATRTVAFNVLCCFIWALGTGGMHAGAARLRQQLEYRHRMQRDLEQSNNLYSALSAANQVMLRSDDPQELYAQLCRIAVEYGHFQLASVALIDADTGALSHVAVHGDEKGCGYINAIHVSTDADIPEGRGPTGRAVREEKTIVTNDFMQDMRSTPWEEEAKKAGIGSAASMPIFIGSQVVGAFKVYAATRDYFNASRIELLEQLRDDLSFALLSVEHKEREEQARRRLEESQKFQQVLLDALPYPAVLARYSTRRVVSANRRAREMGIKVGEPSPCCQHISEDERRRSRVVEQQREDGSWDMICWRPVDGEDDDLYLHFAIDITERKEREQKALDMAHTDPLTGAANRLHFTALVRQALEEAETRSFGILVFDLNDFKPVNDTYGHSAGDKLLVKVARRFSRTLRACDTTCRWGGDEFVIFLPGADESNIVDLMQRAAGVFEEPFVVSGNEIYLSASGGYATWPEDGDTELELFKIADRRMYQTKLDKNLMQD
ncbi:MAG: diguanylate cyclase domain-containing protein [Desulfuromonadaceae bacterium]